MGIADRGMMGAGKTAPCPIKMINLGSMREQTCSRVIRRPARGRADWLLDLAVQSAIALNLYVNRQRGRDLRVCNNPSGAF